MIFLFINKAYFSDLEPIKNILDVNVAQTSKLSKDLTAVKEMLNIQTEKTEQMITAIHKITIQLGDLDKNKASSISSDDKVSTI